MNDFLSTGMLKGYLNQSNSNRADAEKSRVGYREFDYQKSMDDRTRLDEQTTKERAEISSRLSGDLEGLKSLAATADTPQKKQALQMMKKQITDAYGGAYAQKLGLDPNYVTRQAEIISQLPTTSELDAQEASKSFALYEKKRSDDISDYKVKKDYDASIKDKEVVSGTKEALRVQMEDKSWLDDGDSLVKDLTSGKPTGFGGVVEGNLSKQAASTLGGIVKYATGEESGYAQIPQIRDRVTNFIAKMTFTPEQLAKLAPLKPASDTDFMAFQQSLTSLASADMTSRTPDDVAAEIQKLMEQKKALEQKWSSYLKGEVVGITTQPNSPDNIGVQGQGSYSPTIPVDQIKPKISYSAEDFLKE